MGKFYTIKKIRTENGTSAGRIDMYGPIDAMEFWGDEVTPAGLVNDLNALGTISEIECHIFSNGGDMFAGLAIYNILKSRPEQVSVYIEGIAASAATIIACAGDKVYMSKSDMMFYHNMMTSAFMINEHDARELLDEMTKLKEAYIVPYMNKSGKSREEIIALLDGETKKGTWLTADEAIAFRLVDAYTPDNKKPLEMAACISPGVFNYKGIKIDCSQFDKAAEKTAGILSHGGNSMALFGKKKDKTPAAKVTQTKPKPKTEITFVETVCPSCSGAVNLNPETGEVFAGGTQQESQTGSQDGNTSGGDAGATATLARRMPGNVKTAIFSITCPHCQESYIWDTDANTDGAAGTTAQPATPINGGASEPAKKPAEQQTEPAAEAAQASCPNCGEAVDYDTETAEKGVDETTGEEGYLLTCSGCNTQFVEPIEAADPNSIPVGASAKEQAAYRAGVLAERERMLALEEMALAVPAKASMIMAAKKSGASAETMSRNIFKTLAGKGNNNASRGQFIQALQRDVDASGTQHLRQPQHHNKKAAFADSVFETLNNR